MKMSDFWKLARKPMTITGEAKCRISYKNGDNETYPASCILIYFWGNYDLVVILKDIHIQKIKSYKLPERYALCDRRLLLHDVFEETLSDADIERMYWGNSYDN